MRKYILFKCSINQLFTLILSTVDYTEPGTRFCPFCGWFWWCKVLVGNFY